MTIIVWLEFLMNSKRKDFLLCGLVFLCLGCNAGVEQYQALFKSSSKLIAPYGLCSHINRIGDQWEFDSKEKDLMMIHGVGADFVRTDFDWGYCQSDKDGPMSFSHHDKMMQAVDSQNIQMLGILSSPQPHDYGKWLNYVNETVKHFKTNVKYWEVINEADRWHMRFPDFKPEDYVRQLRDAYPLIKKNNRKAQVLFTSITDVKGDFFEEVLNADVSDCFDIMNFHFYVNLNTEPEHLFTYFCKCQEVLNKHNVRKPVWFTETGCTTAPGYADEETQARRLPRTFLISFACGIEKVFWYKTRTVERTNHFEEHFGIWHNDFQPKPAYYAYKTLVEMLPSGSTRPKIARIGDVFIAKWKRSNNSKVTALWTSKDDSYVKIPSFDGEIYNVSGQQMKIDIEKVSVSPSVLYFVGKDYLKLNLEEK